MAQTTGGMSGKDLMVGLGTDGSTYTDVSGYANSVKISGGERETGNAFTFDGDTSIIKAGKRGPMTVTVRGVYTETASQFYDLAQTAYEAGTAFYVRWSPGGGDAGDSGFTAGAGIVTGVPYPSAEADGEPILVQCVIEVAVITEAVIGTAGW